MDDGSGNRGVIAAGAAEDDDATAAAAAAAAAALEALVDEECGVVAREHLLSTAADVVEQHKAKRLEPFAEAAEVCVDEAVALLARRVVVDVARECARDLVVDNRLRSVCEEIMDEVIDVPIGVPIVVPGLIQRVAAEELESFEINSAFEAIYDEVKVDEVQKFLFDVYPAIERTLREQQRQDALDKVVGRMGKFLFRHTAMRQLSQSAAQRHDDFFIRQKNQEVLVHRIMLSRLSEILFANCAHGDGADGGGGKAETTDSAGTGTQTQTQTQQKAARSSS